MFRRLKTAILTAIMSSSCSSNAPDNSPMDDLHSTDWSVEGCTESDGLFMDIEASPTEIATVVEVRWTSTEELAGSVIFEVDGAIQQTPWDEPGTDHQALLLGIPPHTEVRFVAVGDPDDPRCSSGWSTQSGGIPSALPELVIETEASAEELGGFLAAPAITTGQSFLSLIDGQGRYVWAYRHEDLVWRMRMGLDGQSVLFNTNAPAEDQPGPILRVGLDGQMLETVYVDGAHRDFVELPDGSLATLVWELRELEDDSGTVRTIVGDALVEIDASGTQKKIWSIWDGHSPDLSSEMSRNLYPGDSEAEEWTHANALTYLTDEDAYLVSLDAWNSIVNINRSGDENWFLTGGTGGDFPDGDLGLVVNTHSVRPLDNGNLLLFNRNDFASGECAEAIEVELDFEGAAAWKRWSHQPEDCHVVTYLGNAIPLPDDQRLVIFSTSGQVNRVDGEGQTMWQLRADLGFGFGLSDFAESLYPSTED